MKRVWLLLGLIFVVGVGVFYVRYFRGVWPVLRPPSGDIVKIIKDKVENDTGFPLQLPENVSISVFAEGLGQPRVLAFGPQGLLVSIPSEGKIVALPDDNTDGVADVAKIVLQGLDKPHGLAVRCDGGCRLYVAEKTVVSVYDFNETTGDLINRRELFRLPQGGRHTTRYLTFLPGEKNRLLISVGSSCDVCYEKDKRHGTVLISNLDGEQPKIFASGLRNSVFMALHPWTGEVWATEMGRDLLGDDLPPDEINIIRQGKNYGWPICYGKNIHDTNFDNKIYVRSPCEEPFTVPSYIDIPAHSAPLGLSFVPEEGWPEEYRYNLLVAYHGSWNRSEPTGYKIVRYLLDKNGTYLGEEDFISGWLKGNRALGRPAGVLALPGGVVYISDDKAGVVYKVLYKNEESGGS